MLKSRAVAVLAPLLALVVAVGLVVLAVRAGVADTPRAAVGDVVDPYFSQDEPTDDPVAVRVPWAELSVWWTGPRTRLPDDFGQGEAVLPPEGGGFVRLDVGTSPETRLAAGTVTPQPVETVLTLVAEERRLPLTGVSGGFEIGPDSFEPQTRLVAVGEGVEVGDLALEVEYDGVVQRVDLGTGEVDRGEYERLADVPFRETATVVGEGGTTVPCGRPRVTGGLRLDDTVPACGLEHGPALPYAHGLGLAPEGRSFVVVAVRTDDFWSLRTREGAYVYTRLRVARLVVGGRPVEAPAWFGTPSDALGSPEVGTGIAVVDEGPGPVPVRVVLEPVAAAAPYGNGSTVTYDLELEVAP